MIKLYFRHRWGLAQSAFTEVDQTKSYSDICNYIFKLEWKDEDIEKLFINQEMIAEFNQPSGLYLFTISYTGFDTVNVKIQCKNQRIVTYSISTLKSVAMPEEYNVKMIDFMKTLKMFIKDMKSTGKSFEILDIAADNSAFLNKVEEDIKNNLPESVVKQIAESLKRIEKHPSSYLIGEDELVDPDQIQNITQRTIHYFINHSETWERRISKRPFPNKVLSEKPRESFNLYENRFIVLFIQHVIKHCKSLIDTFKDDIIELQQRRSNARIALERGANIDENIGYIMRIDDLYLNIEKEVQRLEKFVHKLEHFENSPVFRGILPLKGGVRANQTILYNKNYKMLYKIFRENFKGMEDEDKIIKKYNTSDFGNYYCDYCYQAVLTAVKHLNFTNTSTGDIEYFKNEIFSEKESPLSDRKIELKFTFEKNDNMVLYIKRHERIKNDSFLSSSIEGELVFTEDKKTTRSKFLFVPSTMYFGQPNDRSDDFEAVVNNTYTSLYNNFLDGESNKAYKKGPGGKANEYILNSRYVLYPESIFNVSDNISMDTGLKLANTGGVFLNQGDFEKYGAFRQGMLPVPVGGIEGIERIKRVIQTHIFNVGLQDICMQCFSMGQLDDAFNSKHPETVKYKCTNEKCGVEWGIIRCNSDISRKQKCNTKVFKFFPKAIASTWAIELISNLGSGIAQKIVNSVKKYREGTGVNPLYDKNIKDMEWIKYYDITHGSSGISYECFAVEFEQSNWCVCPSCGTCMKQDGYEKNICKLCYEKDRLKTKLK